MFKYCIIQMNNKASILLLGLDGSGKTTILNKLKQSEVPETIPTNGFNIESINYQNNELTIQDVGGSDKVRQLWTQYIVDKQGLIYVIDANDAERFGMAIEYLNQILSHEAFERIPIVIFFNKSDQSTQKMDAGQLGLTKFTNPYLIQQCCAKTGEGLNEGIEWLTNNMEMKEEQIVNNIEQLETPILVLGPKGSGKTSILNRLQFKKYVPGTPSVGISFLQAKIIDRTFFFQDFGQEIQNKSQQIRDPGVILILDSSDPQSIIDFKTDFQQLDSRIKEDVSILIYAAKSDISQVSVPQIIEDLGLQLNKHKWHLQECSALEGTGIESGLEWLSNNIKSTTQTIDNYIQPITQIPDKRILMLGDSKSGCTTILYRLKFKEAVTNIPTIGTFIETLEYNDYRLTVYEVGGNEQIRLTWRYYYENTKGLIFVIDASNKQQVENSNVILQGLFNQDSLRGIPLLVFANKQDLEGCISIPEILQIINLNNSDRPWQIQECSAITGQGLEEGIDWLKKQL